MRLLVYGGTQYSERRRIGDWSTSVSSEILQSRKGLSGQRTVYGVGLLDDSPFILVRGMQTQEQRAYPITLLLDLGTLWPDFGWNGARVLQMILEDFPKIGRDLLVEPENVGSAEDLKLLLSPLLKQKPTVHVDRHRNTEGERFTYFWTGATTLNQPLVIGLVSNSLGLDPYPQYNDIAALIDLLPESLRCAVGWVIGGDKVYSTIFNTQLVLDDSQQSEPVVEQEISNAVARGKNWLEAWRTVEANAARLDSDELNQLLQQPLFSWERANAEKFPDYSREHLFTDLRCLSSLLSTSSSLEKNDPEITERFKEIFVGAQSGPLNELIEEAFSAETRNSDKSLKPEETHLVLRKALEQNDPSFDLTRYGNRLDSETVTNFLVTRRIYPSNLSLPQDIQIEVTERLLATERVDDLQNKLSEEVAWLGKLARPDRLRLVRAAIDRSAQSSNGMNLWIFCRTDSPLGEEISKATEEAARRGLENRIGSWELNYLIFADDRDGSKLLTSTPDVIERVARVVLQTSQITAKNADNIRVRTVAKDWLKNVGRSELRSTMPLDVKIDIAAVGLETWHGLRALYQAFGDGDDVFNQPDVNVIEPGEQPFLIHELSALVQRVSTESEPPNLRTVAERFNFGEVTKESVEFAKVLEPLLDFQPDLSRKTAGAWVIGWLELSKNVRVNTAKERFHEKFRIESVRWLLSDQKPDDWGFSLKDLSLNDDETQLRNLIIRLLFGEDSKKDATYAGRMLDFKAEIKKISALLSSVLESELSSETGRATFFRRFGKEQKAFKVIQKALVPETAQILETAREHYVEERTNWYRSRIRELFWGGAEHRQFAGEFVELAASSKDAGPDNQSAFDEAVRIAFGEIPPECKAVFVERFVNNAVALNIIEDRLEPQAQTVLKAALSDHEDHQLFREIEMLLSSGRRLDLLKLLKKQQSNNRLREITSAAVLRCLNPVSPENTFYNKFLLIEKKGAKVLPIERRDSINHVSHLFAALEPRARWAVLNFAFNVNYDIFVDMVIRGFQVLKKHGDDNDEYKQSVYAFLCTEAGKVAKEQLFIGWGAEKSVEQALTRYEELAREMNDPPRSAQTSNGFLQLLGFK